MASVAKILYVPIYVRVVRDPDRRTEALNKKTTNPKTYSQFPARWNQSQSQHLAGLIPS